MKAIVILMVLIALPSNAYFVELNAPPKVIAGEEFDVYVEANLTNFDAANYNITFPSWIEIIDIVDGKIGNTTIPVNASLIEDGRCAMVQNVPGIKNVSGMGYLALIKAKALKGGIARFGIEGTISDIYGNEMEVAWKNISIKSYESYLSIDTPKEAYENSIIFANLTLHNAKNINAANFEIDYINLAPINLSSSYNFSFVENNGSIKTFILLGNESGNISMLSIKFKCLNKGEAKIGIKNVTISNIYANAVQPYIKNSSFTIFASPFPPWDVNEDGIVNILDLIMVAIHWNEHGNPGWIREDVNEDGIINILDLIMVAIHWTG